MRSCRFATSRTYAGIINGSPETASPYILKRLPEQAARMLPPASPMVVVTPPRVPLPGWLCVAEFRSRRGARQTDPDYNLRPYACWFVADTSRGIDAMVEAILPHLDWDRAAEGYDVMDF